jgi:hypothetical protein
MEYQYLNLEDNGFELYFSHVYPIVGTRSLGEMITKVINSYWKDIEIYQYDYSCSLKKGREYMQVYMAGPQSIVYIPLKENKPFFIPGFEGEYKFIFTGLKEHPFCGEVLTTENFMDIINLTDRQAFIVKVEKKKETFFDWKPRRIDTLDYRY